MSVQKRRSLFSLTLLGLWIFSTAQAGVPAGYYQKADGLKAAALKTALYNCIKSHTALSYDALWTAFKTTDKRPDGKVWDIYSNATNYVFGPSTSGGNQCGNYGGEGDCYNREHSFPKSWFGGEVTPMYTDLFHLYPSDGYVNNMRGNLPLGNVATVGYSSSGSYCIRGSSAEVSGLTVFEPADEMKGDLARTYFYMVTRYENLVATWTSNENTEMLGGNTYPALSNWAKQVLLEWHRLDPVSAKEIARNEAIYTNFQHNRNPYIDFPSLAEYVWGDSTAYAFNVSTHMKIASASAESKSLSVWVQDGRLCVQTFPGESVEVLDLSGRQLFCRIAQSRNIQFETDYKGVVFVRKNGQILKVVL